MKGETSFSSGRRHFQRASLLLSFRCSRKKATVADNEGGSDSRVCQETLGAKPPSYLNKEKKVYLKTVVEPSTAEAAVPTTNHLPEMKGHRRAGKEERGSQ